MNNNNSMNWEGFSYEKPTTIVLNILSEGMLCGSWDTPGAGYDNDNDLDEI